MTQPRLRREPSFWNELYWFLAIGLFGWILAAVVLPPRVAKTAQLLQEEHRVSADLEDLRRREDLLEAASSAMENDPFYIDGVVRKRLHLKKPNENYVETPAPAGR